MDIRLNKETEHLLRLYNLDEDIAVDLQQTEQLKDFAGFGRNFVDKSAIP